MSEETYRSATKEVAQHYRGTPVRVLDLESEAFARLVAAMKRLDLNVIAQGPSDLSVSGARLRDKFELHFEVADRRLLCTVKPPQFLRALVLGVLGMMLGLFALVAMLITAHPWTMALLYFAALPFTVLGVLYDLNRSTAVRISAALTELLEPDAEPARVRVTGGAAQEAIRVRTEEAADEADVESDPKANKQTLDR